MSWAELRWDSKCAFLGILLVYKIKGAADADFVLVTWHKPKICPKRLSESEFVTLPSTLSVREIYYYIIVPSLRTGRVSLITTLLDKTIYSSLEVLKLYGERSNVELNLKHLKTTLGMEILRCKTEHMVRLELYVYLLAYNLLCTLMWAAGTTYGSPPLRLSMHRTRHHFSNFIPELLAHTGAKRLQIFQTLLKIIVHKSVTERPGRAEPRVRKRRPRILSLDETT